MPLQIVRNDITVIFAKGQNKNAHDLNDRRRFLFMDYRETDMTYPVRRIALGSAVAPSSFRK